jgi:hypothetical protein
MAEYNVSTVASEIKPPQVTSIGDMLNIARGAQAYQQAQQINPLKLQQEQTATEKAKYELKNQYQQHAEGAISAMQKKINKLKNPKTGEFIDGAQDILQNDADMVESILKAQGVPLNNGGVLDQFKTAIAEGPDKAENFINFLTQKGGAAEAKFAQANPQLTSVGGVPGFATPASQTFNPLNINQQQPGGNVGGTTSTGNEPQENAQPEKIVNESFPNRANTPYVSEVEAPKFKEGNQLLSEAKTIADTSQNTINDIKEARKHLKATSGTALGQGARSLAQIVITNPEYDSLLKSLAQLQMSAAARFGAPTDAARETLAAATGDGGKVSEKALARLLDNAEADLTRDAKYATGLQKFAQKRGNPGGALNAPDFKQAWSDNAKDRKLYLLININNNPELSKAEKELMREEILRGQNKESVDQLLKQMKRMKRLEQGD